MPYEMTWVWVLIPVAAILARTFRGWMSFKSTQRQLGASTRELEQEVAELAKAKAELAERVQNLETIVVSQTWSVLQDKGLMAPERDLKLATAAHREPAPPDTSAVNQQRAEQLARRLE
jgi:hypothetical protein